MTRLSSVYKWLLAVGVISILGVKTAEWNDETTRGKEDNAVKTDDIQIRADIFPFPKRPDPAAVQSAGSYIVLSQLLRTLISLDADTQIIGNLATRWEISKDQKTYKFFIDPEAKFSDGTQITPEDLRKTLMRTKLMGTAIHYDFKKISSILSDSNSITISLLYADPDFLSHANSPEFSPLHRTDYEHITPPSFKITSGAYFLLKNGGDEKNPELELRRNPFYKRFVSGSPEKVFVESTRNESKFSNLRSGKTDFIIPTLSDSFTDAKILESKKISAFKPHIGFTYWISINPSRITNRRVRNKLQSLLASVPFSGDNSTYWERAQQLFLPGGPSRLEANELEILWRDVLSEGKKADFPKAIKILLAKEFPLKSHVIDSLTRAGIKVTSVEYINQTQFSELTKDLQNGFDLVQTNNDFSSTDLIENLGVALNSTRPLIILGEDADSKIIQRLYNQAKNESAESRQASIGILGEKLLRLGLVSPQLYYNLYFYHSNKFSTELWSKLYPEVAFWKMKQVFPVK